MNNSGAIKWLRKNLDSNTNGPRTADHNDKKSSKRLVSKVGRHPKVPPIRLIITLEGIRFIQKESEKSTKSMPVDYSSNRNKLEDLFKQDELERAVTILEELYPGHKVIIALRGRLTRLKNNYMLGLIDLGGVSIERSRVLDSMQNFLDMMEENSGG